MINEGDVMVNAGGDRCVTAALISPCTSRERVLSVEPVQFDKEIFEGDLSL